MKYLSFILLAVLLVSCGEEAKVDTKRTNRKFAWDFSKGKTYEYSFNQTATFVVKDRSDGHDNNTTTTLKGKVRIVADENHKATLYMEDMRPRFVGKDVDPQEDVVPKMAIAGMNEDGSFDNEPASVVFKLIFALPSRDLKEGEGSKIPLSIPFNTPRAALNATGFNTITHAGEGKLDGKKCIILKGEIDASKIKIPEDIEGTYSNSNKGEATYYFDLKNRRFLGVDMTFDMHVQVDTEDGDWDTDMLSKNTMKIRFIK